MEQSPQEPLDPRRPMAPQVPSKRNAEWEIFKVLWHQDVQDDVKSFQKGFVESLIAGTAHKLSKAPHLIGQPLRGTMNRLWKVKFSKFRVVYTINRSANEVWVLSVQKREIIYEPRHLNHLMNLAAAILAK